MRQSIRQRLYAAGSYEAKLDIIKEEQKNGVVFPEFSMPATMGESIRFSARETFDSMSQPIFNSRFDVLNNK